MRINLIIFILLFNSLLSREYIFTNNQIITQTDNDQKFPEITVKENIIHLTWVSINSNNKNIMYSKSIDNGNSFTDPVQVNYLNGHIVAYAQSGPKIDIYDNRVYISYMDDRLGLTSIFLNISYDYGNSWEEEILIADTDYLNAYHDFKIDYNGNLHLIYYNYASNYLLDDVRYRFSEVETTNFNPSITLGIVII